MTFKETEIITKQSINPVVRIPTPAGPNQPAQMPMVDQLGNPIGNGLDVNGNPMR
jgi:hypothetical protein